MPALLLSLGACSSQQQISQAWPADAPAAIELTATPFYPQDDYQCGPAALATLLSAAGHEIQPEALTPEVYLPERTGSLQPELVAAARSRGFVVYPIRGELSDLLAQLQAERPVLILQNQGIRSLPVWHYAVVIGADPTRRSLLSRSGKSERLRESERTFLRRWMLADYWGIILLSPGELPENPQWPVYLAAVADLEAGGQLDAARSAYQAALNHQPELAGARFGLANVQYTQGNFPAAIAGYQSLADDDQLGALALNNLSNLWLDLDCVSQAENALQAAQRRSSHPALTSTAKRIELARASAELCKAP